MLCRGKVFLKIIRYQAAGFTDICLCMILFIRITTVEVCDARDDAGSTAAYTINNNIEIKDNQENSCTPPAPGRHGVIGISVAFFYT